MPRWLFVVVLLVAVLLGVALAAVVSADNLVAVILAGLILCILLGWLVTIHGDGVKYRGGLTDLSMGFFQPVPAAWVRPISFSWPLQVLVVVVAVLAGVFARVFWLVYA